VGLLDRLVKAKAPFILAVALAFFIYQLIILVNSFPADYRIAVRDLGQFHSSGSIWPLFHLGSELTGEVGVILRFAGACFFLAFAITLLWKKTVSWPLIRKAVLLEGIYYLFNIPFIIYLFARANLSIANLGAALSYTFQLLFVTPIFLMLYLNLKRNNFKPSTIARWFAAAIVGFTFALWVKHFALAIYALPLNFADEIYVAGFVNSALTLLIAGVLMVISFMPLLKEKGTRFNARLFGTSLVFMGVYAVVFVVIALLKTGYMTWLELVDWWIIVMPVLGVSLLVKDNP
jgi:hypothetical protein